MYNIVIYSEEGSRRYDNKYKAIIDSLKIWYNSIKDKEIISYEDVVTFKMELEELKEVECDKIYFGDFIKFASFNFNDHSKFVKREDIGYLYLEESPISFQFDLSCAKTQLLFNVLDIYIKMKVMTKDIFEELKEDIYTIINEEEPFIKGCGEIRKIFCK